MMNRSVMMWAIALLFCGSPAIARDAAVEAPILLFVDAFNKGDIATAATTMAEDTHITDEFSPYFWGGHDALGRWSADFEKDATAKGLTDPKVVLGTVTRTLVSGDRAYVIAPSTYSFKVKGVAMTEVAQMTFALRKRPDGWKILAWTWTGPDATPAEKSH